MLSSHKRAAFGVNCLKFTEALETHAVNDKCSPGSLAFGNIWFIGTTMMMMKLPILPCAEKLELVLSTAPKNVDNNDKDSKNRKWSH